MYAADPKLETSTDGLWLVCTDTGVGMSKAIIRDHLLVSGSARRHDVLELERRCKEAGFELKRTGQFGIGVLSYFMLSDRVIIKTRRGQEAGDAELNGWHFETDGIGSFGELRRDTTFSRGTEVRLHIRSEISIDNPAKWFGDLRHYLSSWLLRVPCSFVFTSALTDCETLSLCPGWVNDETALSERSLAGIESLTYPHDELPIELVSHAVRARREVEARRRADAKNEAKQCLKWGEVREGNLPSGLGQFRIHLPYFELPKGASIAFLRVRRVDTQLFLDDVREHEAYCPSSELLMAWRGIRVQSAIGLMSVPAIAEVDWTSSAAGKLSVNRGTLGLSGEARKALEWLRQLVSEAYRGFLRDHQTSVYAVLNCHIADSELPPRTPLKWLTNKWEGENQIGQAWEPLRFPAINAESVFCWSLEKVGLTWTGKRVSMIPALQVENTRAIRCA